MHSKCWGDDDEDGIGGETQSSALTEPGQAELELLPGLLTLLAEAESRQCGRGSPMLWETTGEDRQHGQALRQWSKHSEAKSLNSVRKRHQERTLLFPWPQPLFRLKSPNP